MHWVDIGVNLNNASFANDCDDVIVRAAEHGVTTLIITGTSTSVAKEALELAASYPGRLFSTAGVHPHDAKSFSVDDVAELRELATHSSVVAIGECGLDFNRNYSPREAQIAAFTAQLELAAEMQLPVFIHERDAAETMLELLEPVRHRLVDAVVHCFTGDATALAAYLDLDLHVGITGWVCDERRGLGLRELLPTIPDERLMLETDAPYLLPRTIQPKPKSRRNEPAYLVHVAEVVADLRGVSLERLAELTTGNARRFFRLGSD